MTLRITAPRPPALVALLLPVLAMLAPDRAAAQAPALGPCCGHPAPVGVAAVPMRPAPASPDSLRVVRPMSTAERGVVGLAATLVGGTWGFLGAVAAGGTALGVCLAQGDDIGRRLESCGAADEWLALGAAAGTLAGAARGASSAARRLGCDARESRSRGWRGAALGTLAGAVPVGVYLAADRNVLAGVAAVVAVPTLQIVGATRTAGRCRLPVPLLHPSATPGNA
jgi:hypothetical protein